MKLTKTFNLNETELKKLLKEAFEAGAHYANSGTYNYETDDFETYYFNNFATNK